MGRIPTALAFPDEEDFLNGRISPGEFWRKFLGVLRYYLRRVVTRLNEEVLESYGSQTLRGELYIDTTDPTSGLMVGDATRLKRAVSLTITLTGWPTIPAQGQGEVTMTLTGAAPGDLVVANPASNPENGLMWQAWCAAADTIRVRFVNVTSSPINPADRTWRITSFKYG